MAERDVAPEVSVVDPDQGSARAPHALPRAGARRLRRVGTSLRGRRRRRRLLATCRPSRGPPCARRAHRGDRPLACAQPRDRARGAPDRRVHRRRRGRRPRVAAGSGRSPRREPRRRGGDRTDGLAALRPPLRALGLRPRRGQLPHLQRRVPHDALRAVGGFDRQFPHAAHEDRDLAWRIRDEVGEVRFEPRMRVEHPGRPFTARQWDRRGRLVVDDWLLLRRFGGAKASRLPLRYAPLASMTRRWVCGRASGTTASTARLAARCGVRASRAGQVAVGVWVTATSGATSRAAVRRPRRGSRARGCGSPTWDPSRNPAVGGAPGVAGLLLERLAERGASIDCYVAMSEESEHARGSSRWLDGIEFVVAHSGSASSAVVLTAAADEDGVDQVAPALSRRTARRDAGGPSPAVPYDVHLPVLDHRVLRRAVAAARGRPPLVLHPSVHAAGELRWMRSERVLADGLEGPWQPPRSCARGSQSARCDSVATRVAPTVSSRSPRRSGATSWRTTASTPTVSPSSPTASTSTASCRRPVPVRARRGRPRGRVGRSAHRPKGAGGRGGDRHALGDLQGARARTWSVRRRCGATTRGCSGARQRVGRAVGRVGRDEVARLVARSRCLVQLLAVRAVRPHGRRGARLRRARGRNTGGGCGPGPPRRGRARRRAGRRGGGDRRDPPSCSTRRGRACVPPARCRTEAQRFSPEWSPSRSSASQLRRAAGSDEGLVADAPAVAGSPGRPSRCRGPTARALRAVAVAAHERQEPAPNPGAPRSPRARRRRRARRPCPADRDDEVVGRVADGRGARGRGRPRRPAAPAGARR